MSAAPSASSRPAPLRHCARGDWYAVFGDRATVLLPPDARDRVAGTWRLADDGADFDTLLDHVLSEGLRDLAGLVMLDELPDGSVRVLLRGPVRVLAVGSGGQVSLTADAGSLSDRVVPGVASLSVELSVEPDPEVGRPELVVASGVARVGRVLLGAPEGEDQPEPHHEPHHEPAPEPQPHHEPEPEPDHDGRTVVGSAPEQTLSPPGIAGQPPAPAVTSRPVARLAFSTGEVVDVDRAVVVGRAPEAHRFASSDQPRLITVPSPQQEISSTHLEIRPGSGADHGAAVVTDMGSTNGTVLVQPGLPPEDLRAGIAVALVPGAILDLGDGVTIQTTNA